MFTVNMFKKRMLFTVNEDYQNENVYGKHCDFLFNEN